MHAGEDGGIELLAERLVEFDARVLDAGFLERCHETVARFGDPAAPVHHHVAPRYIEDSPTEVGVPNMVTSVLASYRGFDTLGETVVVFTAGVGVLALLGIGLIFFTLTVLMFKKKL